MYAFGHDGAITYDGSASHGRSSQNAVLRHQLEQQGLPTAGVSTSPHRDRAIFYALSGGKRKKGLVITIDRSKLAEHEVVEYIVSSTVRNPCVPEDEEVILVSSNGGALPLGIVVLEEVVYA